MHVYYINGADNRPLRTFVSMQDAGSPSIEEWKEFAARTWQMDPDNIEEQLAEHYPMLQAVVGYNASCFGPPFFDENGTKIVEFEFPEGAIYTTENLGNSSIKYKSGEKIWFNHSEFFFLCYEDRKQSDINGNEIVSSEGWEVQDTKFGALVPHVDLTIQLSPSPIILKTSKVYPAIITWTGRLDNRVFGYVYLRDKWVILPKMSDSMFIFSPVSEKKFHDIYR